MRLHKSERIRSSTCSCKNGSIGRRCEHIAAIAAHVYSAGKLKISTIIKYLSYAPGSQVDFKYAVKILDRGENALASKHLEAFSSSSLVYYRGSVLASMRQVYPYFLKKSHLSLWNVSK